MSFKKFSYTRNRKLLQLVASLPCQRCKREAGSQAAHSNQARHGKGRGIKASDEYTAALCQACHAEIDSGRDMSRDERVEAWTAAHVATVDALSDVWPAGAPRPK